MKLVVIPNNLKIYRKREKTARRAAAAAKFVIESDDEDGGPSSGDELVISDSDDDFDFAKPKAAAKKKAKRPVSGSEDDSGNSAKKVKKTAPLNVSSDELFDDLIRSSPQKAAEQPKAVSSPEDVYMIGEFEMIKLIGSKISQNWVTFQIAIPKKK